MTLTPPPKNITLLDGYGRGDQKGLDRFYLTYRQEFIKWMENTFQLSKDDAADIYQDAIIVVLKKLEFGKLELTRATLKVYVFGIGRYMAFKLLKKRADENKAWKDANQKGVQGDTPGLTERQELALTLFELLPEPCQSILRMYYFEKLSMREIAERLMYSGEDVVKNQKCRCIKTIRNMIFNTP